MPGRRYFDDSGIAVPCGFAVDPPVSAAVLRAVLNLSNGDLALLETDGTFDCVEAGGLVSATRSAVRLSQEQHRNG